MMRDRKGTGMLQVILVTALALIAAGSVIWFVASSRKPSVALTTPYQAVLLTTGQVYFGKLEGLGTAFPVLREVFYVQSRQDPQTKAVSSILVKRGKEWHAPDRMILNSNMIVLVEPVSPSSRVAQLIAEAQ
jgi:hypothetical protein